MDLYAIYLRKSRADLDAEARGEGDTLSRHKAILVELAKKMNIPLAKIYHEIVSGDTIAARPVMQELLHDVEQGIYAGILVMDIDRLARGDTIDQGIVAQTFKYTDTKIITPVKTYDPQNEFDEEYFEFGLFMSRREYKTINRRLQRGRLAAVKEGKYVSSVPPYGYVKKKLDNTNGFTLEPHPDQADVVRLIFSLYTEGEINTDGEKTRLGVTAIAHRLNALGIPPRKGKIWVSSSIRDIITNPTYIGKLRWNWRKVEKKFVDGSISTSRPRASTEQYLIVDGLHEPLITVDQFNLAHKYMSLNPPRPLRENNEVKNPLCGIIYCSICGRKMVRRPYKTQEPTLMSAVAECPQVSSRMKSVEDKLISSLAQWLDEYKIRLKQEEKAANNNVVSVAKKAALKLDKEIETLDKQINSLHDLLEQGIYSTEVFLERNKLLHAQKERAVANKQDLLAQESAAEMAKQYKYDLIPKIEYLLSVYDKLNSPTAKNDLLKEVIEKVIYHKTADNKWSNPDSFTLQIFPKLPR